MGMFVLDVSSNQTVAQANDPNVGAVMIKATQGTWYVNPSCNAQYSTAKSAGKLLGLYHYAEGGSPEEEATYFINNIKNYVKEAVLALDWEEYKNKSWGNVDWSLRFVKKVHDLVGVWPLVYVQQSAIKQVASCQPYCGLWIADYYRGHDSKNEPWALPQFISTIAPWNTYTIWQYSSTGGLLDKNWTNLNADGWKKIANPSGQQVSTNSTQQPAPTPVYSRSGKSIDQIAKDVVAGTVGSGDTRKRLLGNFYDSVQAVVNYNLNKSQANYANAVSILKKATVNGVFGNGADRTRNLGSWYNAVQQAINGSSVRYYTVHSGDTLSGIGARLGISWPKLASENGIKYPYNIYPNQKLKY